MDPLFPVLPEDLKGLSDEEVAQLLADHESAAELINADDEEFLKGLDANEIIAQYEAGVNQIQLLRAEQAERVEAHEAYQAKKAELAEKIAPKAEEESVPDDPSAVVEITESKETEESKDSEESKENEETEAVEEERVLVTASTATEEAPVVRLSRRPPVPAPDRVPVTLEPTGAALVAAGELAQGNRDPLTPTSLANMVKQAMQHWGPMPKISPPGQYRFGGPEHKLARAEFEFPEERQFTGDDAANLEKIRNVVVESVPYGGHSLTASGGLCAPLTPIYTMPNFGTEAEPVWDSLPVFQATRGGVNVPVATYIGDITTAISSISEANDALGGTFATKSCQALECPAYTETAVQILAHCREYGNLNARAWPEKIAHENALTMQALSRTTEDFMLERIKALSINVTDGLETLGALIYLVDAIVRSAFGIRGRLRMPANARFRALLPSYTLDLLVLDTIQTQFDRFRDRASIDSYLRSVGIDPVYYIDGNFAAGDDQLPDAAQAAGALDGFPNTVQWAIYPEGAFLGIDMGTLELGIVRDSTLNSTNDFQVFGERFRNLVRLAPAEACHWHTTDWCPIGQFPPAGTARTCE